MKPPSSATKWRFRKREVEAQIERLSQPSGAEDQRLVTLAERFGGVLLSEIYDDVTIDDAPYFSALYGLRATPSWCRICRWCARCWKGWMIARKIFT